MKICQSSLFLIVILVIFSCSYQDENELLELESIINVIERNDSTVEVRIEVQDLSEYLAAYGMSIEEESAFEFVNMKIEKLVASFNLNSQTQESRLSSVYRNEMVHKVSYLPKGGTSYVFLERSKFTESGVYPGFFSKFHDINNLGRIYSGAYHYALDDNGDRVYPPYFTTNWKDPECVGSYAYVKIDTQNMNSWSLVNACDD